MANRMVHAKRGGLNEEISYKTVDFQLGILVLTAHVCDDDDVVNLDLENYLRLIKLKNDYHQESEVKKVVSLITI